MSHLDSHQYDILCYVVVTSIHNTFSVGPAVLGCTNGSPQDSLSTASCVTVDASVDIHIPAKRGANVPERMEEANNTGPAFLRLQSAPQLVIDVEY